jgi:hypothetical protein
MPEVHTRLRPVSAAALVAAVVLVWGGAPASAQTGAQARAANSAKKSADATGVAPEEPPFHEYKGVRLGMSTDEARKKLGNPQNKSDEQDVYSFSDDKEMVQVYYEGGKVSAIAVMYIGAGEAAPTPKAVFGETVAADADGSVRKMERYPKAGYWLSYSRTPGDAPMVTVTLRKID